MSTKIFILGLGLCLSIFVQCKKSDTAVVYFQQENSNQQKVSISIGEEKSEILFDDTGKAIFKHEKLNFPTKARVHLGFGVEHLYLAPGSELRVNINKDGLAFDGENAKISEYLNTREIKNFPVKEETKPEELISGIEAVIAENIKDLESQGLDKDFVKFEKEFLKYSGLNKFVSFYTSRTRSKRYKDYRFPKFFFDKLESYLTDDAYLININAHRSFVCGAIQSLMTANNYKDVNYLKLTLDICNYAQNKFNNTEVIEHVVHTYAMAHVKAFGMDGTEKIVSVYKSSVKDPELKKEFWNTYNKWSALAKGEKSPSFNYLDINGKAVKLEDLKGKYIYIDMWATWCTPCCREIPFLQKLEDEFHGRNIHFVSISSDDNKKKWEKKVRKDNLGGIQLNTGGDRTFSDAYLIRGIPRFILLDKEGNIISAKCTRPSNPKTRELLSSLPGI